MGHGQKKYDINQLFVHLSQMMERSKMGGGFVCGGRRQASLKLDSTTSRKVADFFLAALSGPFPWLGSRREFNAHESVSVFLTRIKAGSIVDYLLSTYNAQLLMCWICFCRKKPSHQPSPFPSPPLRTASPTFPANAYPIAASHRPMLPSPPLYTHPFSSSFPRTPFPSPPSRRPLFPLPSLRRHAPHPFPPHFAGPSRFFSKQ